MQYTLNLKLKNGERAFFGPGPAHLLRLVDEGHSLNQAAARLGIAYSKAWRVLREAEQGLGYPLLDRQRGGSGGGGSALTENAKRLLQSYERFQKEMYQVGNRLFQECFGELL